MKNVWTLTRKDLTVFFRDRGAMLWLFVLPLVFLLIFSGLASMGFNDPGAEAAADDNRPPLVVVNLDPSGDAAALLLKEFDQPDGLRVIEYSLEEARGLMDRFKINRYLVISEGFSQALAEGKPVTLSMILHPNSDTNANQTVLRIVNGMAGGLSLELQILDGIEQMKAMQAANPQVQTIFDPNRVLAQAKTQFDQSRQSPLISIRQTEPLQEEAEKVEFNLGSSIVPGMTVLFVFLAASAVARSIFDERKSGSLRRLLSAPLRRWELLLGKMLPVFLLTLVQICVIFLAGAILLPVLGFGRLEIGNAPFAWALTSIVIALCATALGVFISSIARTEGQITGLSNALLWVAGFLGGAIVPAVVLASIPVLGILSRLMPHYWATTAYYDILARGKGLVDVLPALGILLVFSAVFFGIGIRRFRFQ